MAIFRRILVHLFAVLSELALIARMRARLLAALAVYLTQPVGRVSPEVRCSPLTPV